LRIMFKTRCTSLRFGVTDISGDSESSLYGRILRREWERG